MEFTTFVSDLANGEVHARLSEALEKLTEAVQETHQKGTCTVTFSLSEEGRQIKVDTKIDVKNPQHPLHSSLFFHDPNKPGQLSRDDPKQLPLKGLVQRAMRDAASAEERPLRDATRKESVNPDTGEVG